MEKFNISRYIGMLLFENECVILPDFGGFLANYKSAEIDFEKKHLIPPRKAISFNSKLTQNDGLLINFIAKSLGCDYKGAKKHVMDFVTQTSNKLKSGENVKFDRLGEFHLDENRNLQFTPDSNTNFLLEVYGLSSCTMPNINLDIINKIELQNKSNLKGLIKDIWSKETTKRVIISLPVILALAFLPVKMNNKHYKIQNANINPISYIVKEKKELHFSTEKKLKNISIENIKQEEPALDIIRKAEEQIALFEKNQKPNNAHLQNEDIGNTKNLKKHQLLVGSFKNKRNAQKLIKTLNNKGLDAHIFFYESLHRVSIAESDDLIKLRDIQQTYQTTETIQDYWILSL